jgi:hypothetical protein
MNNNETQVKRLVRRFLPAFHHQSGLRCGNWSVEYWPGDEQWKNSLHLNWNWRGRGQWLCVFIPEMRLHNAEVSEGGPLTHKQPAAQSRPSLH